MEDTDEGTFARVGEYLYTDDYTPAKPIVLRDDSRIGQDSDGSHAQVILERDSLDDAPTSAMMEAPEVRHEELPGEPVSEAFGWGPRRSTKKDKRKHKKSSWGSEDEPEILPVEHAKTKRQILWDEFVDSFDTCNQDFRPRQNMEPNEDYSMVFIAHAQLYCFADKYDIQPLAKLALSKLGHTLAGFKVFEERIEDVVELLEFCYANTPERVETRDKLRNLIIKYVACVMEKLTASRRFLLLLGEANSISPDLTVELCKRLE